MPSPNLSALRSILSGGKTNPSLKNLFGKFSFEPENDFDSVDDDDIVDRWESNYIDSMDLFPDDLVDSFDSSDMEFTVTGIYRDGMITGECREGAEKFKLFVKHATSAAPPAGCSCPQSSGERPCAHGFYFLDYITDELVDDDSSLSRRIRNSRFDTRKPPLSDFRWDNKARIRHMLDCLPTDVELSEEDAELPPLKQVSASRIAWNTVVNGNSLQIFPMLQQAKKRGDGWTKGRKIPLENLSQHTDSFSDADRRIQSAVRVESTYYRPTWTLHCTDALPHLIGASNVFFNGNPATVELLDAAFVFCKDAQDCWLALAGAENGKNRLVLSSKDCLLQVLPNLDTIQVSRMRPEQIDCVRAVLQLPKVPLEFEAELLDRAQKLRSVITVRIPESIGGKVVPDSSHGVVLLRSHTSGALDYGLRIRDSQAKLHKPGCGVMIRAGERDGKKVQIQRSAAEEHRQVEQLAGRLNVSPRETDGSIGDFETALKLIGQLQELEDDGVEVLWDKTSEKPMRMLGTVTSKNVSVGINQKRDWLQLSGKCDFGKTSLELVDLLNALHDSSSDSSRGDYVRVGDKGWTKIEQGLRAQLQALRDAVNVDRRSMSFDATSAPAIRGLLTQDIQVDATAAWRKCLAQLERAEKLEPVLPEALCATLRDYQTDGFCWLRRLAEWGVGGILADDMGLGKTLQTLAVILDRSHEGPTLVIAPTSVGFNWIRESQRFAPGLEAHLYRETDRSDFLTQVGPGSLVVCSYGLALRDAEQLAKVEWAALVLDEAQAIKNSRSKTSTAIAGIPAKWKVALTGTPVENHLGELWSLFRVISPGVFGGWDQFRRRFAAPIEKDNDEDRRIALRDRLKPFVLRRTKAEVLKDLPPRTEVNIHVELTPAERVMYDKVRLSAIGEIDALAKLSDVQDQRFRLLALLTRLRQLACSPRMVHETWTERSSKLIQLRETLQELREEGHRVLIFSQFVKHLTLIREMLDEDQVSYEYLDGSTPAQERQKRVDRFQEGTATAFLISLKAGGTGLNLTAADYVIHMDPWWNPAVEDQATDRAHRIGQDKPVMVYRLISQGTIEEEILKLHDTKRDLVAGVMDGTHTAAKLSTEDLIALVRGNV